MFDAIAAGAGWFIGLFATGASTLWALISGVIPLLLVFLTFMNALTSIIGQERMEKLGKVLTKNAVLRYAVMPVILGILTTTGSLFISAKFTPDHCKPAYADAYLTFLHPSAGLFPHVHASEVWVYMGLATGIMNAGLNANQFAVRAFLVVIPIMLIRGIVTERITVMLLKRAEKKKAMAEQAALA
ncbi:MAG: PTS glucitol/sorbitol transporter subunit IIC [Bacillota bacterium]|jgi:PTS system glucitol/sorbitol-specific IIC component|nr:PTS sorbitol transporter subunit IIC [Bacillota bacterium]HOC05986.1 PTS glucitol/sorbitol transporter subunit IIC [Bacillota bacterium]HPZ22038.1 PTS glucitol/sorbitol transporter subunit IIC [Bacillota bacterium]HQD20003.1 PTS glucitol/sorbitol transporter subunit IIC [Bacillota bacterium]